MKYFILVLTIIGLLTAQEIHISKKSALIKDYIDDGKICDRPHMAIPLAHRSITLVDSSGDPCSATSQVNECLAFNPTLGYLQFVHRGYDPTSDLYTNQFPADLSFQVRDFVYNGSLHGSARRPTSVATDGPHISFPVADPGTGSYGHVCAAYEAGGWFSSSWNPAVDLSGDIGAWACIGKQLPDENILHIGLVTDPYTIVYYTTPSDLSTTISSGVVGTGGYWGFDINGDIAYVFYYDPDSLYVFYRTTTDGINWSPETQWNITYPTPYANNDLDWKQMALTDAGNPIIIFDIGDDNDPNYPQAHRVYVQVGDGATPVQISDDAYTASFYPTVATGGDNIAALFHVWTNTETDSLSRNDVFVRASTDGGASWGQFINLTETFPNRPGIPQLAKRLDATNGDFFAFFGMNMVTDYDILWSILTGHDTRLEPCAWYLIKELIPGVEENAQNPIPQKLQLEIYPNPFRQITDIRYEIPTEVDSREKKVASIKIYDATGRLVRQSNQLTNHQSLINQITWHGDDDFGRKLPAGVYFVRLENRQASLVKKIIKLE